VVEFNMLARSEHWSLNISAGKTTVYFIRKTRLNYLRKWH